MKTSLLVAALTVLLPIISQAKYTAFCGYDGYPVAQTISRISEGETLAVLAEGNPTTGYDWLSLDGLQSTFELDRNSIGSGGMYTFKKQITKADEGKTFKFIYVRAWTNENPIRTCTIQILSVLQ